MTINRFALSLLSKSRKNEALNEEMMIHKKTGEIVLKGVDGEFISYNKTSRLSKHVDTLSQFCYTINFLGKIYTIDLVGYDLPDVVEEDTNIIEEPVILTNNTRIEKLLVSLDLDALKIQPDGSINGNENMPVITIVGEFCVNSTLSEVYGFTFSQLLDESNINIIIPEYPSYDPLDVVDYSVKITSLTITRNGSDLPEDNLRYILNSILCVIKEEI